MSQEAGTEISAHTFAARHTETRARADRKGIELGGDIDGMESGFRAARCGKILQTTTNPHSSNSTAVRGWSEPSVNPQTEQFRANGERATDLLRPHPLARQRTH